MHKVMNAFIELKNEKFKILELQHRTQ